MRHSRVARSNIWAHKLLGNEITLVGPRTLVPDEMIHPEAFPGAKIRRATSLVEGIEGADVVMVLRMQLERQKEHFVPSLEEYTRQYCVNSALIERCCPDAVVLHPGPANRGLEISSELLESERALVRNQVTNGVAVRMAILFRMVTQSEGKK